MNQIIQFMNILALALIHFAWMAAIIGIAVWTGRRLISSATVRAQWRYRIGMIGMFSMLLAIPLAGRLAWSASKPTTIHSEIDIAKKFDKPRHNLTSMEKTAVRPKEEGTGFAQAAFAAETNTSLTGENDLSTRRLTAAATSSWQSTITFAAPWFSIAYIVGLAMMFIRIGMMCIGCRRILSEAEFSSDLRLAKIIERHARQVGLARLPTVATSQRVTLPVIVGIWKPVILLPTEMLSGLTMAEIEIVLYHEIAHFRRHDPIVVFIQRVMETILFFHPAAWLVSRGLERDREICCDEMVLATGASRIEYASVLCRVAEFAVGRPKGMSLAVTGSSSTELVFRVGNILGHCKERPHSKWSWPIIYGTGIATVLAASLILSNLPSDFAIPVVTQDDEQSQKDKRQDEQGKTKKQNNSEQHSATNKYEVTFDDYRHDHSLGFEVISKLVTEAEDEKQPPETLAKLRYHAAKLQRFVQLRRDDGFERDFSISIGILREVVGKPHKYLANKTSGIWFRNCVALLAAIYEDNEEPKTVIDSLYQTAIEDIKAAMGGLTSRDRFLFVNSLRVYASDRALHAEDWPAAIELVQPVIDEMDEFLKHADGANQISMAVRQQSMFLAKNNEIEKSVALIDLTCKKLEKAHVLDDSTKIINQCMLRGKNLINFQGVFDEDLFEEGWEKYQKLEKRALTYDGPDRVRVLRSCLTMDRLAIAGLPPEKVERAIKLVRETMALIEADPELQDPEFGVFRILEHMSNMTISKIREDGIQGAKKLQDDVKTFIAKYKK